MSPVSENDSALVMRETFDVLDIESICRVTTVHKATFLKLARNSHDAAQLADFFQDIASTYLRTSEALRRELRS